MGFFLRFICFLAVVGLHCCMWAFSSCSHRGLLLTLQFLGFPLQRLLLLKARALGIQASAAASQGSGSCGSQAVVAWHGGSSQTRDGTGIPCRFLTTGAPGKPLNFSVWTSHTVKYDKRSPHKQKLLRTPNHVSTKGSDGKKFEKHYYNLTHRKTVFVKTSIYVAYSFFSSSFDDGV